MNLIKVAEIEAKIGFQGKNPNYHYLAMCVYHLMEAGDE
jgi:hypothetical protein